QADTAAARVAATGPIEAVYASPLERARETAAPIAKATGNRVRTAKGLHECDFGDWTGASLARLRRRKDWKTVQQYPSGFRFPGGESFREMQARIANQIADLAGRHAGAPILTVSHADPIKAPEADPSGTHLDLFQRVVTSPCAVTAVLYTSGGPTVLSVSNTAELTDLRPS
ncbi:MAG: phosphoglycerate mutase, partial [Hyphomicrobiales bacterium]|nr:phosphoglycerate mutase [Hyphomicrobiales bacterium]